MHLPSHPIALFKCFSLIRSFTSSDFEGLLHLFYLSYEHYHHTSEPRLLIR